MKVLVFHIGADRYGLPLAAVARVLPAASLKAVPLAPPYVAGLLDLHGTPLPVIDVARLAGQVRETFRFDTRIVLADYRVAGEPPRELGLLLDGVAGIAAVDESLLVDAGLAGPPFLGQLVALPDGLLQLVALEHLLTPEVRALLFPDREHAA